MCTEVKTRQLGLREKDTVFENQWKERLQPLYCGIRKELENTTITEIDALTEQKEETRDHEFTTTTFPNVSETKSSNFDSFLFLTLTAVDVFPIRIHRFIL